VQRLSNAYHRENLKRWYQRRQVTPVTASDLLILMGKVLMCIGAMLWAAGVFG
jgi:hypothetical protein